MHERKDLRSPLLKKITTFSYKDTKTLSLNMYVILE